ncbi:hypothetical protein [Novosphingobium sp. JCM 18896]|uniref:hypothetical protein n=1 Tax=Novosphingobium sp. JCM 18896 TaxID=2989731 RepID=UPI0022218897|nr:hypothetical protein [Novosphingobium sp. JCM 18896]MCW1428926.1 hypothetical protein [Novosphingobium sp. JCM 18896]
MKRFLLGLGLLALCGASAPPPPTRILDAGAAQRLRANKGVTLQWIDWNSRGSAHVAVSRGVWTLRAAQAEAGGPGRLLLDGRVTEIGRDYFLFDGTVRITDTPDKGRTCEKRDVWRFAVTQNRRYWRIRTFEWCDDLTDYVDIYF